MTDQKRKEMVQTALTVRSIARPTPAPAAQVYPVVRSEPKPRRQIEPGR